ncbi:PTS glucitol/sorbitol transporter subunit IIA [Intestinibacillus sp. Marseille-P6563]|uniref:PTS glucitol/sorbitol transporter subunit IIA n=1 Tax=Intestinibacillus sp. Marseille-P6563 TaxID=2364792 RepID=UPI000F04C659|nr:PTS glucitol/sorbitol transporter subunit IIA [Intestinibacillus sp. Marseille-P6563]
MKYCATITGWGEDALGFLADEDCNFMILFNEDAPAELAEIAVLHTKAELAADPAVGDTMMICDKVYDITAVGDEALHTLRQLGHCTLSFKGGSEPERPGCIMLEGEPLRPEDVVKGGTIEIY